MTMDFNELTESASAHREGGFDAGSAIMRPLLQPGEVDISVVLVCGVEDLEEENSRPTTSIPPACI
jgi:hypothetical protein